MMRRYKTLKIVENKKHIYKILNIRKKQKESVKIKRRKSFMRYLSIDSVCVHFSEMVIAS